MSSSLIPFSDRLGRRWDLWWGRSFRWTDIADYGHALRRLRASHTFRRATDSDALWQRDQYWQRTIVNKWNGREFAARFGARVPELYWFGRRLWTIPFESLPPRFVIRPVWGANRDGIHVIADGRELLRHQSAGLPELRQRLRQERGALSISPLLVEEFIATKEGEPRLPVEYKCHTFGDTVAAIQMVDRTAATTATFRYYTPQWEQFDDVMDTTKPPSPIAPAPACLAEMLDLSSRIGQVLGTYMRVDFFATDHGCVFNEFASTPQVGSPGFTPYCNELFGALWRDRFPDAS
jgi:TupA-like ATPgrasp